MDQINYDKLLDEAENEVLEKYRYRRNGGNLNNMAGYIPKQQPNPYPIVPNINVSVSPVINVISKERQKNSPLSEVGRMISSLLPTFLK